MRGIFGAILGGSAPPHDDDRWYNGRYDPGVAGGPSVAGPYVTPESAMRVSAAYACVNLLARTIASLPLSMYRRSANGDEFEAPEHPLNELLAHQPNAWQTAWDFKAMLQMHLALRGNAYAEILPGQRGAVDRLEPLHPDRVVVDRLSDGSLRYTVAGWWGEPTRRLLQDEILHIRSAIAPGIIGLSPISYARQTIGLALAAEEHGGRQFSNGARPSGVVQVKRTLSDPAFERFKAGFNANYGGLANANKTPILEEGAEFKPISMTSEEMQFLQTREFEISEICRWFDVPPVLLHHLTSTTSWGTGVEAIMLAFVRNNLMPWLSAWTQAIRRDLIIAANVYFARFDTESLQRGDSRSMAEFISRLVLNGVLTRNEGRQLLGYNPLDNLDEPLVPTNTTTPDNMPQHSPPPGGAQP